ncbi:MAG TPA: hypothetical protein VNC84_00285 [Gammaproteobacteria bacterium]|jgi:hypothetical protein|nr:hypothetical protein [Gammaproteobacteria bacterium]
MLRKETIPTATAIEITAPTTTGTTSTDEETLAAIALIKKQHQGAEQILSLIPFLAFSDIPIRLLIDASNLPPAQVLRIILALKEKELIKYSDNNDFISLDDHKQSFINRSKAIDKHLMLKSLMETFIRYFTEGGAQDYLQHVKACTKHAEELADSRKSYLLLIELREKHAEYIFDRDTPTAVYMHHNTLKMIWRTPLESDEILVAARILLKLYEERIASNQPELAQVLLRYLPVAYAVHHPRRRMPFDRILAKFIKIYRDLKGLDLEDFFLKQTNFSKIPLTPHQNTIAIFHSLIACFLNKPIPVQLLIEVSRLTKKDIKTMTSYFHHLATYQENESGDIITLDPSTQDAIRSNEYFKNYLKNWECFIYYLSDHMEKYIVNYSHHIYFFLGQFSLFLQPWNTEICIKIALLWAKYAEYIALHLNELEKACEAYSIALNLLKTYDPADEIGKKISISNDLSDIVSRLDSLRKTYTGYAHACNYLIKAGKPNVGTTPLFAKGRVISDQIKNPTRLGRMYKEIEVSCDKNQAVLLALEKPIGAHLLKEFLGVDVLTENVLTEKENIDLLYQILNELNQALEKLQPYSEENSLAFLIEAQIRNLCEILINPKDAFSEYTCMLDVLEKDGAENPDIDLTGPKFFITESLAIIPKTPEPPRPQIVAPTVVAKPPTPPVAIPAEVVKLPPKPPMAPPARVARLPPTLMKPPNGVLTTPPLAQTSTLLYGTKRTAEENDERHPKRNCNRQGVT